MADPGTTLPSEGETADASGAGRRAAADPLMQVRAADIEPYLGLGYLSKLFRLIAVFLLLLLVLEVSTGLYTQGADALPTLLTEISRLIVLAGLLWGAGDLATLLIDVGHDVRAARILLGRQAAVGRSPAGEPGVPRSAQEEMVRGLPYESAQDHRQPEVPK